jgi:ABC-type phosphate transport system substrate-binding protein
MSSRKSIVVIALAVAVLPAPVLADVVAVVSVDSHVTTLTKNQLTDIFLGKAIRFPDGTVAVPVDQAEGSSARDEFYLKVAGKSAAQLKAYWSKIIFTGRGQPPPVVANGVELKKRLGKGTAVIGYIDASLVDDSVRIVLRPGG